MYENLQVDRAGAVGVVTLRQLDVHHALNGALMCEFGCELSAFEQDDGIGAIAINGGEGALAAGSDIKEIRGLSVSNAYLGDFATEDQKEGMQAFIAKRLPVRRHR